MTHELFLNIVILALCVAWAVTVFVMRHLYAERLENEFTPKDCSGYICYVVSRDIKEYYDVGDLYMGGVVVEGFSDYQRELLMGETQHVIVVRYSPPEWIRPRT